MKIVLSPNPYRDKGLRVVRKAQEILRNSGAETVMSFPFDPDRANTDIPKDLEFLPEDLAFQNADMMVCFGGDGTILHSAKIAQRHGVPILGVNLGSVGFIAELEMDQLQLLSLLPLKRFRVEERMMLDVLVRREGRVVFTDHALNDAVVTKGAVARVITLDVKADNTLMSRFSGDGVIVSTPTGSTGYAMSAGGPIVEPTAENLLITPICAHALYARSFVLDGKRSVTIRMDRLARKTAYLSVDGGRAFRLGGSDQVELRRSQMKIHLARLTDRSFYAVLDQKLGRS